MAVHKRAATIADDDEQFDRSTALRLGVWGVAAVVAVTLAVLAGRTDLGAKRLRAAYAAITASPGDPPPAMVGQLLARTADMEREARRLAESVRALTGERERLTTRLGLVEREMGDLTGSITRSLASQTKTPDAKPATTSPPSASAGPPPVVAAPQVILLPPNAEAKSVRTVPIPPLAALNEAPPEKPAEAAPATAVTTSSLPEQVPLPSPRPSEQMIHGALGGMRMAAHAPHALAIEPTPSATAAPPTSGVAEPAKPEVVEPQPKAEIGLDLGPALTMARLRARWAAFKAAHSALAEGLRPIVSIREIGQNKPVEMRLVVGPVADVNAATGICAQLAGSQFICHPAVFDGQRLALK
jgi:hypothetical protein